MKPPPFVRRHALLQGDTLPALALRYGTSSAALKMMNSLGSEHAINSRSVIYVPVPVDSVCGALCAAIFDGNAQREVAIVVQGEEELKAAVVSENAGSTRPRRLLVLLPLSCASTAELSPTFPFSPAVALLARSQGEAHASRRRAQDRAASRLNEQLRRALNTDEATVSFYLASKGGDVKEAVRSAMEDAEWERALLCRASHDAAGSAQQMAQLRARRLAMRPVPEPSALARTAKRLLCCLPEPPRVSAGPLCLDAVLADIAPLVDDAESTSNELLLQRNNSLG